MEKLFIVKMTIKTTTSTPYPKYSLQTFAKVFFKVLIVSAAEASTAKAKPLAKCFFIIRLA
jgi:hypothetical protein